MCFATQPIEKKKRLLAPCVLSEILLNNKKISIFRLIFKKIRFFLALLLCPLEHTFVTYYVLHGMFTNKRTCHSHNSK